MTELDNPIFSGAAVLFTLLLMLSLRSGQQILPHLLRCLGRWKANIEIEDSLQLSRSRNLVALLLFVPMFMVVFRFSLYRPDFVDELPLLWRFPAVAGALAAYLLLRTFLNWQFKLGNYRNRVYTAANRSFYNYAILLFVLLAVLGALLSLGNGPERHVTLVLRLTALLFYLLIVLRRGQIFASACGPFTTFLYLCGLELIPTGVLVATAVLL